MNTNHPQNNQKYPPSFAKTSNFSPQQSNNQTNISFRPPVFHNNHLNNGHFLSPTDFSIKKDKIDRVMYTSTIEPSSVNKNFTFGKLDSMARFIPDIQKPSNNHNQKPSFQYSPLTIPKNKTYQPTNQQTQHNQITINSNKINDFDRFPSFNLQKNQLNHEKVVFNNNLRPEIVTQNNNQFTTFETLTPEQKRRREILAIKQQLETINKKIQNSHLSKKSVYQPQKTEIKSPQFITNNNQFNEKFYHNQTPQIVNNANNLTPSGLTFTRNTNKVQNFQRNKGMIAQSMIVSTEPSPGYKYQSIFDKYDSLKKPVYETKNNVESIVKQNLTLDSFLNKKPHNPINQSNQLNNPNNLEKQKKSNPKTIVSEQISNQKIIKPKVNNLEPIKEGLDMFKKKKNNFSQEIKVQTIIYQTQNAQKNNLKAYQKNVITQALNSLKISESTQFVKEDFAIGKKLGKGQFGQVMLVQHKKTGFICGMKVMQKKQIRDEKYEGQISRQLSIQFYLSHRNIAPLYGYFQDEKNVYLLVEYCSGGQLLEMLRKNRRMEEPEVSRVIKQIIEGMDYIHKQLIIHRDIKPQNILFNYGVAKICDFGWAVYKGHGMRKTASVGSPLYYSPEIVMGVEYDQKIDIWDIGMMTYECLLGKIPFRIYSELDLNRIVEDEIKFPEYIDISEQAKDFILRIMKKKPQERMEVREMLRHPFITKYQEPKLIVQIMKDFKQVLS